MGEVPWNGFHHSMAPLSLILSHAGEWVPPLHGTSQPNTVPCRGMGSTTPWHLPAKYCPMQGNGFHPSMAPPSLILSHAGEWVPPLHGTSKPNTVPCRGMGSTTPWHLPA